VAFLPVHERVDPLGAALGAGVVEKQDRLPLKESAHLSLVGTELLDDRCVPVVGVRRHGSSFSSSSSPGQTTTKDILRQGLRQLGDVAAGVIGGGHPYPH